MYEIVFLCINKCAYENFKPRNNITNKKRGSKAKQTTHKNILYLRIINNNKRTSAKVNVGRAAERET